MNKLKIDKRKEDHPSLKDESCKKLLKSFLGEGLIDRNGKRLPAMAIPNIKNFVKSFN